MPAAGQGMHHHIQEQLWQPSGSDLLGAGRFWVGLSFFSFLSVKWVLVIQADPLFWGLSFSICEVKNQAEFNLLVI
jgi:hypothetical protein